MPRVVERRYVEGKAAGGVGLLFDVWVRCIYWDAWCSGVVVPSSLMLMGCFGVVFAVIHLPVLRPFRPTLS